MPDEVRRRRCLIIAPRTEDFSSLRADLVTALRDCDVEVMWPEHATADGTPIAEPELHAIERADFIIADLTRGDPDVMYQVGVAHAWRIPVHFIIRRNEFRVPSALRGNIAFAYDNDKHESLRRYIKSLVAERYMVEQEAQV
jgi:hypothetical protein